MEPVFDPSECIKAAARLEAMFMEAPEPEILRLCGVFLRCIADDPDYASGFTVTAPFLQEAMAAIRDLCGDAADIGVMHDRAFALMECMAVIAREHTFRKGAQKTLAAQADLMRFFEKSGHWAEGDGTLVSEYYYSRIPNNIPSHQ